MGSDESLSQQIAAVATTLLASREFPGYRVVDGDDGARTPVIRDARRPGARETAVNDWFDARRAEEVEWAEGEAPGRRFGARRGP